MAAQPPAAPIQQPARGTGASRAGRGGPHRGPGRDGGPGGSPGDDAGGGVVAGPAALRGRTADG